MFQIILLPRTPNNRPCKKYIYILLYTLFYSFLKVFFDFCYFIFSQFNDLFWSIKVKVKTKFEHNHDIVYHGICAETDCSENYIGETARRISERVKDHTGKDVHSHLFKHAVESGHKVLDVTNYSIIGKGYGNNIKKRKIAEALLIKEIKPTLNRQDQSIALRLFN